MKQLSQKAIDRLVVELHTSRRLYQELHHQYEQAKLRIQALEEVLARERHEREESVEALKLQIEELREIVFGRRRGGGDDGEGGSGRRSSDEKNTPAKKPRPSASYRRPTPKDEEVTRETFHSIDRCPDCSEPLTKLTEAVRYLEDIVLPALSGMKTIEKQRIEAGFCTHCRRWRSVMPIAKQVCSLGENVRQRIVYCITVLGMTFEKVERDLKDTFGITIGNGELTNILTTEAAKLLSEYHDIDARIRGSPCQHLDETSWPVQREGEGQWGWVKTASDSPDTVFRLGRSRGKSNATALIHDRDQPTVTDDYAAYDGCSDKQGLCWAHPKRKFQDLAESASLTESKRQHCRTFYACFSALLSDVRAIVDSPYDRNARTGEVERLRGDIAALTAPHDNDPKNLATFKATFFANTERYLLCVREPNIPMTNNKAERSVRPLVIKRKLSFGSKTQKGADVMSILLSVCLTTWWSKPKNFYAAYSAIVRKWQTE
jgi:transposase